MLMYCVLILVVVDDGLVPFGVRYASVGLTHVLILVVVDDGLVLPFSVGRKATE